MKTIHLLSFITDHGSFGSHGFLLWPAEPTVGALGEAKLQRQQKLLFVLFYPLHLCNPCSLLA